MSRSYKKAIRKDKDKYYHRMNNRLVRHQPVGQENFHLEGKGFRKVGPIWNITDWKHILEFEPKVWENIYEDINEELNIMRRK